MRFLADMGISRSTVRWLNGVGHDAVHLHDEGLQRLPDSEVLAKARREDRVLLTADLDFGYILALSGEAVPGVVLFRVSDMRHIRLQEKLEVLLSQGLSDLRNFFVVVTDSGIRIRQLPIGNDTA